MNRLTVSADGLGFMDGEKPFVWRGGLDWSAMGLLLEQGEAAYRALLRDRRSVGQNTICVAGMLSWGHPFMPETPGYWNAVRDGHGRSALTDIALEEGMRVCVVVLCDTAGRDLAWMRAHWQRWYVSLGDKPNVTFVLANQAGHPSQGMSEADLETFERTQPVAGFPAALCAKNNPFEDNPVPRNHWDFSAFCAKRNDPNWFMEAGCVSMWTVVHDQAHAPAVLFEPIRCGDKYPESKDPGKWRQLGRSLCFKGTVGGNFYSDDNAQARPYAAGVVHDSAVEFLGNIPLP